MMHNTRHFVIISFLLAAVAYFLQTRLFLNGDVALLLHETQLFLSGGHYATDFFETNPPMIFYLYSPVCMIATLFSCDIATALNSYVLFLIAVSMVCSFILINKIIKKEDALITYALLYTLLFVLLFLPTAEFGQREHLFLIFMLPYVLSVVCAASQKNINPLLACLIGLMMGMGVGLKPYFLLPLILIELYLMITKRHFWTWIRYDAIVCASVLILYLISIVVWQMNYMTVLLPLINHLYFSSIQETWIDIFSRYTVIFCLGTAFFYFFQNKKNYPELLTIIWLALLGTILAFVIARSAWFYHVIPALGLSCLLVVLYITLYLSSSMQNRTLTYRDISIVFVLSLFFFFIPLRNTYYAFRYYMNHRTDSAYAKLVTYLQSLKQHSPIYCFSVNTTADCFPLIYLTHSDFGSRMPFFWWLRGIIQAEKNNTPVSDKTYLINSIADDLNHYHVQLIVINIKHSKGILGKDFNYISYLSQNKKFQDAWKRYHYLTQIDDVYQIYQRDSSI